MECKIVSDDFYYLKENIRTKHQIVGAKDSRCYSERFHNLTENISIFLFI